MIEVVAAVIVRDEKYLIAKKPARKGGAWEFPGGKVEVGETFGAALEREIQEELGVEIQAHQVLASIAVLIKDQSYRIHFMSAKLISDRFKLTEHQSIKWVSSEELQMTAMSSADLEFVKHIKGL